MSDDELPPSKLGTKDHWDQVYKREVDTFDAIGDEGEVWFGESSVQKMHTWAMKHLPTNSAQPLRILECGSGNGTLLLSFLPKPPSSSDGESESEDENEAEGRDRSYHLTGIDYSEDSIALSKRIEAARRDSLETPCDTVVEWRVGDLLNDSSDETWDLVMDKGTYDALSLSDEVVEGTGKLPSVLYPGRVARLVNMGGFFLITSCNFTEEEIKKRFGRPEIGLEYHSRMPHPSFSFGGKSGTRVCTVAFRKVASDSQ